MGITKFVRAEQELKLFCVISVYCLFQSLYEGVFVHSRLVQPETAKADFEMSTDTSR